MELSKKLQNQLSDWLLAHESDIAWGIMDYGDFLEIFEYVVGRKPVKQ